MPHAPLHLTVAHDVPPVTHRVVALAHDGMSPFELGIAAEVFGLARPELDVPWWYGLTIAGETRAPMRMLGGLTVYADADLGALAGADTVVIPAWPTARRPSPRLLDTLLDAHARGARILTICSGAFLLAATGLLDGLSATTHWRYADLLRRRHPSVSVDPDVLYIDHGRLLTSAGSAAGIDVCLHLVRRDHGAAVANVVARRMVMPAHRDGGQAQFIERPVAGADGDDLVRQAADWALSNLDEPLRVEDLAARAYMSTRTFTRRFNQAMGTSPRRWVIEQRVAASLPLLEETTHPVEHVSALVGFSQPGTFRQHFLRIMRTPPSAYRRAFRARDAERRIAS
jgi:AraC family transcriptional activator FtrA